MSLNWQQVMRKYPEANFLQSPKWANVQKSLGHLPIRRIIGSSGWCQMFVVPAKRARYLEIPGGPLINWHRKREVEQMFRAIKKVAKEQHCAFIRFRPQLEDNDINRKIMQSLGARRAPMHLGAEHTVMIDLKKSEDDLLADMRRQTRYEVRKAAKLKIEVKKGNSEALFREFHAVQAETARLQHFVPPSLETLLAERKAFGDHAMIYVAYTEGQPIAYGLILYEGSEAAYYEAASTPLHRKLPGAYALQWQVMRDLKKMGIKRYNLWGIAPDDQPNHRYAGVTTFKTGLGGEKVAFIPAQDIVMNKLTYLPNKIVETIRRKKRHL